ncbi:MAG: alpha-galactosidase [Spirochaetales bacterium]|nr:alpha-galactosidase [Spirochaetales bacterium]
MMDINICIIGGASRLWAITLFKDLAAAENVSGTVRLYDIDHEGALRNKGFADRIFGHASAKSSLEVIYCSTVAAALEDADFVIITIEPGPIELRFADLVLPEKFGILQTVGDTTGPGGLIRAQRSIPIMRHYARQIMKYCPDAWVINYSNPMTICTQTLYREEKNIKAIGCCHEVFGTQHYLAKKSAEWFTCEKPERSEITLGICGLNHFTLATSAHWKKHDLYKNLTETIARRETANDLSAAAKKRLKEEKWFEHDHRIAFNLLEHFGAFGAAGDRHLAEFVPWYLTDRKTLHRYGVICTPYKWRVRNDREKKSRNFSEQDLVPEKSDEEGVEIMKALHGEQELRTNVNYPNSGQIPWLPKGHIVETNALFSKNRIKPEAAPDPSVSLRSIIACQAVNQQLIIDAVYEDDMNRLFQAFLCDPLMKLPTVKARELFDQMQEYQNGIEVVI